MRFIHVRGKRRPNEVLTIGYVLDEERKRALCSIAKCSRHDAYEKEKGNMICRNRFEHGTGYMVPVDPSFIEDSIVCEVRKRING